jgi:MFS superfamily sulfate permease-like transporter
MPITRVEFETGMASESLAQQIRKFLEQNEGYAFTWEELYARFFPNQKKKWAHVVMGVVALSQLTSSKQIECRRVEKEGDEGEMYYAIALSHPHYG